MAADALAPRITRSSAVTILTVCTCILCSCLRWRRIPTKLRNDKTHTKKKLSHLRMLLQKNSGPALLMLRLVHSRRTRSKPWLLMPWLLTAPRPVSSYLPWWQDSWGQCRAHLGPPGPRWAPRWSHEPCYLGSYGWARSIPTREKLTYRWVSAR